MEKCINCNKEYKIRGIKLHRKKCDKIYFLKNNEDKKYNKEDSQKIKNVLSYLYLPDDCIKIIY